MQLYIFVSVNFVCCAWQVCVLIYFVSSVGRQCQRRKAVEQINKDCYDRKKKKNVAHLLLSLAKDDRVLGKVKIIEISYH